MSKQKSRAGGFTIIEILIVMAVAGLILTIIFMAIPTLQRSGRNNQRKQDVQTILAAVSHYQLNNSGNFPPSDPTNAFLQNTKLSYYDKDTDGAITVQSKSSGDGVSNTPNIETVAVYNHQKCNPDSPGQATTTGAGYADIVALYANETTGAPSPKCQQL